MPLPKTGKRTDQRRKTQNEYDLSHFKVAACKISIGKYEKFQAIATAQHKTVSGLLSEYIDSCIAKFENGQD